MHLSQTEENYLKALFHLSEENNSKEGVGTNDLANHLEIKPASVNDLLKRLKAKDLVDYHKYGKIHLTSEGRKAAVLIVRKHRLWETFLFEKLDFSWDEVHEVAEQLEHIKSPKLIAKLEEFLDYPTHDPHGDVIPNVKGEFQPSHSKTLAEVTPKTTCKVSAVKDDSADFLQYIATIGLKLHQEVEVIQINPFDLSLEIQIDGTTRNISKKVAEHIFVE